LQDLTSVWARVCMTPDNYVEEYTLFSNAVSQVGDMVSARMGKIEYVPPTRVNNLPSIVSDPLLLLVIRGETINDIGTMMPETLTLDGPIATVVWLHALDFDYETLSDLTGREPWVSSMRPTERKVVSELLGRLRPKAKRIQDSA